MHEEGRRLTIVGVVEVDDFLPAVISHRVDDSAMIIRTHAYGEIQETRGRCQNLKHVGRTLTYTLSTFRFYSAGGRTKPKTMGTRGELLNGAVFPTEHDEDGNAASANVTVNIYDAVPWRECWSVSRLLAT